MIRNTTRIQIFQAKSLVRFPYIVTIHIFAPQTPTQKKMKRLNNIPDLESEPQHPHFLNNCFLNHFRPTLKIPLHNLHCVKHFFCNVANRHQTNSGDYNHYITFTVGGSNIGNIYMTTNMSCQCRLIVSVPRFIYQYSMSYLYRYANTRDRWIGLVVIRALHVREMDRWITKCLLCQPHMISMAEYLTAATPVR